MAAARVGLVVRREGSEICTASAAFVAAGVLPLPQHPIVYELLQPRSAVQPCIPHIARGACIHIPEHKVCITQSQQERAAEPFVAPIAVSVTPCLFVGWLLLRNESAINRTHTTRQLKPVIEPLSYGLLPSNILREHHILYGSCTEEGCDDRCHAWVDTAL
jgi:hypothetical protein